MDEHGNHGTGMNLQPPETAARNIDSRIKAISRVPAGMVLNQSIQNSPG